MFLNEGEKENFLITERVLESSKKKKKKRERELEKERAPGTLWWMGENEEEKEGKRGVEILDNVWRRKKKEQEIKLKHMVENEMEKEKNNIKNKKS